MKKVLFATTALVLSAGFAAAEVSLSGSAQMGLMYDGSKATDKTTVNTEAYMTFGGAVQTDGGLELGSNFTIATYDGTDLANDGSNVYISGAFGKLTFGDVGEADEIAALADIGFDGIGTDNIAEFWSGDSVSTTLTEAIGAPDALNLSVADQKTMNAALGTAHNVNYAYSVGDLSVAASARVGKINDSYAVAAKYNLGSAYVGLGYNNGDYDEVTLADEITTVNLSTDAVSAYVGGTFGAAKVAAMYTDLSAKVSGVDAEEVAYSEKLNGKAYGFIVDYTVGATVLSAAYSKAELEDFSLDAIGLGASYDLGGGAALKGGIARIEHIDTAADAGKSTDTQASLGVTFSF